MPRDPEDDPLHDDAPDDDLGDLGGWPDDRLDEYALLTEDVVEPAPPPAHLVAVPWRTRVEIPALQLDLPAVLDPTRPDSEWRVAEPPETDHLDVRLRVGAVEIRVRLNVSRGEPLGLVLGRDALAGRILVQS